MENGAKKSGEARGQTWRYTPLRASLTPHGPSWCTIVLVSYNLSLIITIGCLYLSLRNSCNGSLFSDSNNVPACKNYKTVDMKTESSLKASFETILQQYATTSMDPADDPTSNITDELSLELSEGNQDIYSRVNRARTVHRKLPVGFAHFHAGRGPSTNYHVDKRIDIWEAADWVDVTRFKMDGSNGAGSKVTIQSRGLYYIYSQVTFRDVHPYHGYTVYIGDEPHLQCYFENPLLHCTGPIRNGVCEGQREERCAVCYTGGLVYINKKEKISIQMVFDGRIISGHKADTFFGLLKVK